MAECQTETEALLDKVDAPIDVEEEDAREFAETALKNIRGELQSNLNEAQGMTDRFGDASVSDVINDENVRKIDVRAKSLENPRVTVWLNECPIWANHAWRDVIFPDGHNSYNGNVTTSFDVRKF